MVLLSIVGIFFLACFAAFVIGTAIESTFRHRPSSLPPHDPEDDDEADDEDGEEPDDEDSEAAVDELASGMEAFDWKGAMSALAALMQAATVVKEVADSLRKLNERAGNADTARLEFVAKEFFVQRFAGVEAKTGRVVIIFRPKEDAFTDGRFYAAGATFRDFIDNAMKRAAAEETADIERTIRGESSVKTKGDVSHRPGVKNGLGGSYWCD